MAEKNNRPKYIKHKKDALRDAKKRIDVTEKETVCECWHQEKDGEPALRPTNKRNPDGSPICFCKVCQKEVFIGTLSDELIDTTIATTDKMCDLIKISLDGNSERDQKLGKRVAKMQLRNLGLKDLYNAAKESKKRKKKNNNGGSGSNMFTKPITR